MIDLMDYFIGIVEWLNNVYCRMAKQSAFGIFNFILSIFFLKVGRLVRFSQNFILELGNYFLFYQTSVSWTCNMLCICSLRSQAGAKPPTFLQ